MNAMTLHNQLLIVNVILGNIFNLLVRNAKIAVHLVKIVQEINFNVFHVIMELV